IYCEPETTPYVIEEDISPKPPPKPERSEPTSPKSPTANVSYLF
ncbi:unnamed protein product, partial [Rotaria magnacalcarata]